MKLSVCATFISLSLLVGCQSTSLTSTDSSDSISTADSSNQIESTTSSNNNTAICPVLGIQPVTVSVSDLWANGDVITDAYTGNIAQVVNGEITLTPSRHSGGVLLLESEEEKARFSWDGATFYHIATDRFFNGNSWNDHSYGRQSTKEGFQGGDIVGLTKKLDYLAELGVDVVWISTPLEQVHGWLPNKSGNSPEYPYAGGATLDWTQLDTNMGSEQEMRTFVDLAHQLGMRVMWSVDTAPSIPTLSDLQQFSIQPNNSDALPSYWSEWQPQEGQNLTHYLDAFKNKNGDIPDWWSEVWMEENNENAITLPAFFANKPSTKVKSSEKTKNEYLAGWMSAWVSEFGIDGFVVSNSTPELTQKIEQEGKDAFTLWNKDNAYKALENASFRVIDLQQQNYFSDQMLSLKSNDEPHCLTKLNTEYVTQSQAEKPSMTRLTWFDGKSLSDSSVGSVNADNYADYRDAATALLLSPNAVSIWYGDETAKMGGIYSKMNWNEIKDQRWSLQSHWKKLIEFRNNHSSIANGEHQVIKREPYYAFIRKNESDSVMVVYTGEKK
ncbi:alpha-amylase [Aliivibrio logei]|uniref:Alpha-amylase n=1 Tax=Aliivibrio logei 5S-186 TaxID=626086 RepID=A0ABX3AVD6_ALILO|nr:alpha-amylase [Aliivibrio logei]OEF13383.1 alpha-amylase [Aliivibrio logei 5S-186]